MTADGPARVARQLETLVALKELHDAGGSLLCARGGSIDAATIRKLTAMVLKDQQQAEGAPTP